MADIVEDFDAIVLTLRELFSHEEQRPEHEILSQGHVSIEHTGVDNWNGGTDIYGIQVEIPPALYAKYDRSIRKIEKSIADKLGDFVKRYSNTWLGEVVITPQLIKPEQKQSTIYQVDNSTLSDAIEAERNVLIAVSTGGPRIQSVNDEYKSRHELITLGLAERGLDNPNPYSDLWEWYGRWSSGDLPSYQSRRNYINGLFSPLTKQLRKGLQSAKAIFTKPTGWARVDRNIGEVRIRLAQAITEEQFQAIGLLCRETMISLAQIVYDPDKYPSTDGISPSKTDAKRMIDAYLAAKLSGKINEATRRHAKASLDLANELTHKRTADFLQAAVCAEATTSVVNIIAIISGQRNP